MKFNKFDGIIFFGGAGLSTVMSVLVLAEAIDVILSHAYIPNIPPIASKLILVIYCVILYILNRFFMQLSYRLFVKGMNVIKDKE